MMKLYKFLFDVQTGEYKGIVREPFPENSTNIQPHFQYGFKTIFDQVFNGWKLVPIENFYSQMETKDKLRDADMYFKVSLDEAAKVLNDKLDTIRCDFNARQFETMGKINAVECLANTLVRQVEENRRMIYGTSADVKMILSNQMEIWKTQNQQIELMNQLSNFQKKTYWTSRIIDAVVSWYWKFREICRVRR